MTATLSRVGRSGLAIGGEGTPSTPPTGFFTYFWTLGSNGDTILQKDTPSTPLTAFFAHFWTQEPKRGWQLMVISIPINWHPLLGPWVLGEEAQKTMCHLNLGNLMGVLDSGMQSLNKGVPPLPALTGGDGSELASPSSGGT
ncbi:hypothetical protein J6590_104203 [Homalodisca vitripennis]|nr:hypothetical protein J6590_104203 [Homalodisca vitripennis]